MWTCYGGWATEIPLINEDNIARLCVVSGWRPSSSVSLRFLWDDRRTISDVKRGPVDGESVEAPGHEVPMTI